MASSPILEKVNNLTSTQALVIGLGLAFLYYQTAFNDGSQIEAQMASLAAQIEEETVKKKETERLIEEESKMRAEIGTLGEKFNVAAKKIPVDFKSQEFIDMVTDLAKKSGTFLSTIEPLPMEARANYDELKIKVGLKGTYSNLTLFLYYIASVERISNIINFNYRILEAQGSDVDTKSGGTIQMDAEISSYRFRQNKEKPADANGAGAEVNTSSNFLDFPTFRKSISLASKFQENWHPNENNNRWVTTGDKRGAL